MQILLRVGAAISITFKRLRSQWWLTLSAVAGLTVAIAIALSIPLYADAVYGRTLNSALLDRDPQKAEYPPLAILFRRLGSTTEPINWSVVQTVDAYLGRGSADRPVADFGLPESQRVRFLRTENLSLFPGDTTAERFTSRNRLGLMTIGAAQDFDEHIVLTEGRLPAVGERVPGQPFDALVSVEQATKLGFQVGETYLLAHPDQGTGFTPLLIPLRIAGVWQPKDPAEAYWFYKPWALTEIFFLPDATFEDEIVPLIRDPVQVAAWYIVLDGSGMTAKDAPRLAQRINAVAAEAEGRMPGLSLVISPLSALARFERASRLLAIQLAAFSVPILGLLLAFIALVVGLRVNQQRHEIAMLRSRGATAAQVLGIAALEALLLNAIALVPAWPLGQFFAGAMARTRTFLVFEPSAGVQVRLAPSASDAVALGFGLALATLAFVIQLVPTFGAARHTIVLYRQDRARSLRPPLWQRLWLDALLVIPTAYGVFVLSRAGALGGGLRAALPSSSTVAPPNDPFQNPLLFLVPALGVLAFSLLFLRALPLLLRSVVWIVSRTRSSGFLLAVRHLARAPSQYNGPLVLLTLTLSLSAYTASLATTLDRHLRDQSYYTTGADLDVYELGQHPKIPDPAGVRSEPMDDMQHWLLPPVSDHLRAPGVKAASRVGRYSATLLLHGDRINATYMGVDHADFPKVAFWRADFGGAGAPSLRPLMGRLAANPAATLMPARYLREYGLKVGDQVRVEVSSFGYTTALDLHIAGAFDLFPTWVPDTGPLFVGNLNHYFERLGYVVPYRVWMETGTTRNFERMVEVFKSAGLYVVDWQAASRKIAVEQRRPERQGLLGVLSIGFLAAALLTVLGFLLYAFFSFRRRAIELGILRAIGLSGGQMTTFLGSELAFLIGAGLVAGTVAGAGLSRIFIPYLQVGSGAGARVPPFMVEIAWPAVFRVYALFGILFVAALIVLGALLFRLKVYQAIKLGETT